MDEEGLRDFQVGDEFLNWTDDFLKIKNYFEKTFKTTLTTRSSSGTSRDVRCERYGIPTSSQRLVYPVKNIIASEIYTNYVSRTYPEKKMFVK